MSSADTSRILATFRERLLRDRLEGNEREAGHYDLVFRGEDDDGNLVETVVGDDRDPGYGSTSKIIGELALCLLDTSGPGGLLTPSVALGATLIERLRDHAGLRIEVMAA